MAKSVVSFTRTQVEEVHILSTRVNKRTNQLMVGLDTPWEDISDEVIDLLFNEVDRLSVKHPTLEEGWSPAFYHKSE